MPVGACWARDDVAAVFEPGDHGSTYSGTAIATAAVNAVIAEMRRIDAPALAATQGERLATALAARPGVAVGPRARSAARRRARRPRRRSDVVPPACSITGLVVNAVTPTALRLAPPITVTDAEIDEALAILVDVLR